ncbi:D-2-hydroxyacid dehydrogenase [Bythopirellula goksoeyrii]|uniref:2-hydroxyacid dehydrogenase n=1 Tax=Bythopirellula goksoeyrii TaxID=1400387 RepID=A0A5B9Q917_9BACT|nr:D-2-hydroxyacid dehydrogenase [Bythopirellula goksoeyrii]QEG33426.1 Putative 2-hydroxyacid dehydrogenase [Bythopirellula goksoeyrii]
MPIVVIDAKIDTEGLERLRAIGDVQVKCISEVYGNNEEQRVLPAELICDAEILLCTFPPTNFDEMHDLKLIQVTSSGYQQLEGLNLVAKGIRACNGLGEFDVPIAEWTISMIVNLCRDLRTMIRNQEAGHWDRSARHQSEVRGRTLGIWGYGGIGRETARLAKSMGLQVHVLTRRGVQRRDDIYRVPGTGDVEGTLPDRVFHLKDKDEFLSNLDFLVLSMPLNDANRGIVSHQELRLLPEHAYILNPARGPLVDEEALLKALREKWIAGAALDAHYHYPMPADHPLWRFPNVIMTPHVSGSGSSTHFASRVWDIFVQNVEKYREGKPLLNELSPSQLN